jgi:signal transduction histidine kinase
MKFWQKAFLGMLIVFILAINICLFLISRYSYSLNINRDTDRALGEYHFILNSVYETMNSLYYREQAAPTVSSVESFMRSYAGYYSKQNVYLELWDKNNLVFSNIPSGAKNHDLVKDADKDNYKSLIDTTNEKNYLYINGKLGSQYENYTLIYARDLSELYNSQAQLTRYLIIVSAAVEVVLALILIILLRKLTFPIRALEKATGKIADGNYDERINLPGRDEFHDLADTFNQMTSRIQEHIAELNKTAQDKQRLVDNLAHELRTPLTAIRGYAEYLQNANACELDRIKASGYILSETARMQNLAFKLLDLALVRNSTLDLQPINPCSLMNDVKSALEAKLTEKNIELKIYCQLDALTGDFVLLQSLLINLVDNAIKASSKDSEIKLQAYYDIVPILEVQDFGCGMEEKHTAMVCEPFYRVDKARTRSSGGIGLGLSLCQQIASLHGAELNIESKALEGTRVQVIFTTPLQPSENSIITDGI